MSQIPTPYPPTKKTVYQIEFSKDIKNPKRFVKPVLADGAAEYCVNLENNPDNNKAHTSHQKASQNTFKKQHKYE